ncbi:MAG: hypothetical protein WC969_08055 [Elusimicrobiota bacterium]|jgi:hypothetical protein
MKRKTCFDCWVGAILLLLIGISGANAKTEPLDFWIDANGKVLQLNLVKEKTLTLGRGFPAWDKPVGLLVTDYQTGKELAKLVPDGKDVSPLGAYWLNTGTVVFNLLDDSNRTRKYHTGVWHTGSNRLQLHKNTGSGAFGAVSGIDKEESVVVSCPYGESEGVILRDLGHKTTTQLYNGFIVTSPRFAPNGLRFAAFARPLGQGDSKLVLHMVGESGSIESVLNTKPNIPASGRDLRWSPSGRYIAGVVWHNEVARPTSPR